VSEIRLRYACGCVDRWTISRPVATGEEEETLCSMPDGRPLPCTPARCGQCQATKSKRWCHVKYDPGIGLDPVLADAASKLPRTSAA
jgi:hypothetical protein